MTTAQVSGYTRKDGTHVSGYTQGRQAAAPGKQRSLKGRAQLAGAGSLAAIGAVQMLTATMSVVTAVLTVTASSLLAWGGYRGVKRRRKRRGTASRRRSVGRRFGSVQLSSEAEVDAYIKLQEWRQGRRRERWGAAWNVGVSAARVTGQLWRTSRQKGVGVSDNKSSEEQRPSRRWDGEPETAADRRFFDLRESGYKGWIDQDGYAVDAPPLKSQP